MTSTFGLIWCNLQRQRFCKLHDLPDLQQQVDNDWRIWQYGLWSFQTGDTKLEKFVPKNQNTQRKV